MTTKTQIDDAVVERLIALARNVATNRMNGTHNEANAIVALLPEPVDPDLIEAREELASFYEAGGIAIHVPAKDCENIRAGLCDDRADVKGFLAAIKRGRALERGE